MKSLSSSLHVSGEELTSYRVYSFSLEPFEVFINSVIVFSKCNVGRYPTADDVNKVSIFIIAPAQLKFIISIVYDIKGCR